MHGFQAFLLDLLAVRRLSQSPTQTRLAKKDVRMALLGQVPPCRGCGHEVKRIRLSDRPWSSKFALNFRLRELRRFAKPAGRAKLGLPPKYLM